VVPDAPPRRRRWLRRLAGTALVLLVLAVVLLGGAGWYYAGEIHAGALAVDRSPRPAADDTLVEALDGDRAVLRRTGEAGDDDPLRRPETYGLVWDGGAGVVSGAPEPRDDGSVVRFLDVVDGEPPAPGTPADLRGDVWTDPTTAHGVDVEDVAVPCAGGTCPAWFVPGEGQTWMVFVHGKGGSRAEGLRALGPAVDAGLPSLLISYRNDEGAPADPSGEYRYGDTEWRDLEAAVDVAIGRGAERLVLFGASMGGGIVAAFLERSDRADVVAGVVLDAPMLDLDATVAHGAAQRELPVIGALPHGLTSTAEWLAAWRYDLDWDAVDHLPADWLDVPALVFHGTADRTVPLSITDELAAGQPDRVQVVRVPGAGHVRSWNVDPRGYERREAAFLACVTAAEPPSTCPAA
jgi:pimeloyl-ACP methyl ester carboxylesterase